MPLSTMEREWLAYARQIFHCPEHRAQCNAPRIECIDHDIRWPGFVGPAYERAKTRLLFVGRIHNPSGWAHADGIGSLEALVKDWLAGRASDDSFYHSYSREYAARLRTWGPWKKVFSSLAEAANTDETSVAYANGAKCWQRPGRESASQRRCSQAFPLQDLVSILRPHGVFVLATDKWLARAPNAVANSVSFMNASARHFNFTTEQMARALQWAQKTANEAGLAQ